MIRIGIFLLMLSWVGSAHAAIYYRYKTDDGQTVISQSIPARYVSNGYEILNGNGRVIEVVPRALNEEELAAKAEAEVQEQLKAEQRARDKKLLSIFSSPEDAERARDRKLEAIDVYINVTKGNIIKLQGDYNQAQTQAAQRERAGEEVPEFLLEKMQSLSRQMKQAEESIERKEQEKDEIRAEYEKDISRLKKLMEDKASLSDG